jgi:hypothetical protein
MTLATAARREGDDFQARLFWLNAALLLDPASPVMRVAYERGPKAFDDVLVEYDPTRVPVDHRGCPIAREYLQCKWHVGLGEFGYAELVDPRFINATTLSFLQRAHQARLQYAPGGEGCRFKLVTNWRIAAGDPLFRLLRQQTHAIDLPRLFDDTTERSMMGMVRRTWRDHLTVDDATLRNTVRVLAITQRLESAEELRERLNERFGRVGLKRIARDRTGFMYDDLIGKLHAQGRSDFSRESFEEMCRAEGLFERSLTGRARNVHMGSAPTFGVRSRMHPIDNLENRCQRMLDFVPYFDDRFVRTEADWRDRIFPELRQFLITNARSAAHLRLVLDVHVSLAFAAGSVLNVKSGKQLEIEQQTGGRAFWAPDDMPVDPNWTALDYTEEPLQRGDDIAIAIGLTHDVAPAVRDFVQQNLAAAGRILHVRPSDGRPSARLLQSGSHAWALAEAVTRAVRKLAGPGRPRTLHLFMAVPNGFAFFLGQNQPALGRVSVYEFDFEGLRNRSYGLGLEVGT